MKKSYFELLKDPRWQKKRLEIMERDGWSCRRCSDCESTLSVHHQYYEKGFDPWDYDSATLITLCDPCHKKDEQKRILIARSIAHLDQKQQLMTLGYISGIALHSDSTLKVQLKGIHFCLGLADSWGVNGSSMAELFTTKKESLYERYEVDHYAMSEIREFTSTPPPKGGKIITRGIMIAVRNILGEFK